MYFPAVNAYSVLDLEGVSKNATLVVVLVGISSLKIPKAFLIRSAAQRNFAYTFMLIFPTVLPSQIFCLLSPPSERSEWRR